MPCQIPDFLDLVAQLPEITSKDRDKWISYDVAGRTFAYLWPDTRTVGLKQTIVEQRALVAERPEVFEIQYTSGGFGWVVVYLDRIERDELAELTFEAWRLTATSELIEQQGDQLPS